MGTTSPDLTENDVYIHIFICDFEEGLGFRVTYIYIYVCKLVPRGLETLQFTQLMRPKPYTPNETFNP